MILPRIKVLIYLIVAILWLHQACIADIILKYKIQTAGRFIPSAGNNNPIITVLVYTDNLCHPCHEAIRALKAITDHNKDIKVVYKEFPIQGRASLDFSCMALAAHIQGKYFEFKSCVAQYLNELADKPDAVFDCFDPANRAGIDIDKAKQDMNNIDLMKTLKMNLDEVKKFVTSDLLIPIIVIGDTVIKGDSSKESLEKAIENELKLRKQNLIENVKKI